MLDILSMTESTVSDRIGSGRYDRQALIVSRELGDRVNQAVNIMNLGLTGLYLDDLSQSRRDLDASLELSQANGDRALRAAGLACLSSLALWQGDAKRAAAQARTALGLALAAKDHIKEVCARLRLGHAERALGHTTAARQAYAKAQAATLKISQPTQHDASAGLAAVALSLGEAKAVVGELRPVLDHVAADHLLHGAQQPRWIEPTCHRALARAGDPRAFDWLARAHGTLMAEAEAIADTALHQSFLHNIPHHREIVAAWGRRQATSQGHEAPGRVVT